MTDDCVDCTQSLDLKKGLCYWHLCDQQATRTILTDGVNHKGLFVPTGDIELCWGHWYRATRLGRLDLDWNVINQALAAIA